jgi:hypothetical protein
MTKPQHMNFADRRVFALNLIYARALRKEGTNPADPDIGLLAVNIAMISSNYFSATKLDTRADEFLAAAIDELERICCNGATGSERMAAILTDMKGALPHIDCSKCYSGKICDGRSEVADDIIVAAVGGGRCISEIKEMLEDALVEAGKFYEPSDPSVVQRIKVALSTLSASAPSVAIPGHRLGLIAETYYDDTALQKSSMVTVTVAPSHFDLKTLSSARYVLFHEVIAHCYQFAAAHSIRPKRAGTADPVSEGLIDIQVKRILYSRARAKALEPNSYEHQEYISASEIHLARASGTVSPPFRDHRTVQLGRHAETVLHHCVSKLDTSEDPADIVARLSAALNLADWNFAQRLSGMTKICGIKPKDEAEFSRQLENFIHLNDVSPLISWLLNP